VPLNFTVDQLPFWITYSLDGHNNITVAGNTTRIGLTDGYHTVTVYAANKAGDVGKSQTVNFTVAVPPEIDIIAPLNHTYNESSVQLTFIADKPLGWAGYSLDGQQNVSVTGNCTLSNITNGFHSILVYANGTYDGMGVSQNVTFTVALSPTQLEVNFSLVNVALFAVGLIVAAGIIVYFKVLRKRPSPI
jgi:hypothetical protein